jgi:transmembrane sensor
MDLRLLFSRTERIKMKAAEWHAEMLEPHTSERRAKFEEWLASDPEHAREYSLLDPFSTLSQRLPSPVRRGRRSSSARLVYGLAAATIVILVMTLLLSASKPMPAYAAVTNPGPAIRMVRLADGSNVTLDAGTQLSVTFKSEDRQVELRSGRARFKIVPDPDRPFIVSAGSARVMSVGGEFDVGVREGQATVVARRESVTVDAKSEEPEVSEAVPSGQAVRIAGGAVKPITISHKERLWPAGRLSFDQARLADIVSIANRLGGPPIRVSDESVGASKVTAILDLRDTRALARKLGAALDVGVQERPDGIVLTY